MADSMINLPVGYCLEFRPGDRCYYGLEDFARETHRSGAVIRGLYREPQPGCEQAPSAYRGRFWHEARHYAYNGRHDPGATPLYMGPVLHDPGAGICTEGDCHNAWQERPASCVCRRVPGAARGGEHG